MKAEILLKRLEREREVLACRRASLRSSLGKEWKDGYQRRLASLKEEAYGLVINIIDEQARYVRELPGEREVSPKSEKAVRAARELSSLLREMFPGLELEIQVS